MNKLSILLTAVLCCTGFTCFADAQPKGFPYPSMNSPKSVGFVPVDYVKLTGGHLAEIQDVNNHYIAYTVKPDRMLEPFRIQAHLPKKADRYDGWEDGDLSGHAMGHYLSSLAYVYRITGNPQAKKQMDYIVDELAKMQAADPDGYVLPVRKEAFTLLKENKVESKPFNLNGLWAPFYTLHKVMAGLRDIYYATGNRKALDVERKLGDFVISVVSPLTEENTQKMLHCEFGGMNEVMADLTADTGDKKYLDCAINRFYHKELMDPLSRKEDHLTGMHVNTMLPEFLGIARIYELTGEKKYRDIVTFFFDRVVNHRTYVTGGQGDNEHFFEIGDEANHLFSTTTESCNCYNMLKLAKIMFEWKPDASIMDFAERATLNHVVSVIRHDREGAYGYFQPLGSVAEKCFSSSEHVWTCCVGTGMENPGRYGELVAGGRKGELYLNQFWDADVSLDAYQFRNVTGNWPPPQNIEDDMNSRPVRFLSVSGGFPYSNEIKVKIAADERFSPEFTLKIRKPYWSQTVSLKVNDKDVPADAGDDGYIAVNRKWNRDDILTVSFDFRLRAVPTSDKPGDPVCIMYGPFVLAGIVPPDPTNLGARVWRADIMRILQSAGQTYETAPIMVADSIDDLLANLVPTEAFAQFKSRGLVYPKDLEFRPLMDVMDEHYAVFFKRFSKNEWETDEQPEVSRVRIEAGVSKRLLAEINPGFVESEKEHGLEAGKSEARTRENEIRCRFAPAGASFRYTLHDLPVGKPLVMVTTVRGRDSVLKVHCVDKELFSEDVNLTMDEPAEKTIHIPADAVAADGTLTISFSGTDSKRSPEITKIRILNAEK